MDVYTLDIPRLNFNSCHVAISEGSQLAVAMKCCDVAVRIMFNTKDQKLLWLALYRLQD